MKVQEVLSVAVLGLLLTFTAVPCLAQPSSQSEDPAVQEFRQLLEKANQEIREFGQAGGKNDDPSHPAEKWAAILWKFREEHAGTEAAALATSEAIHLLIHADRFEQVYARADSLELSDPAWLKLAPRLMEAASRQKDYSYLIAKIEALHPHWEGEHWASLQLQLGQAYWQQGELEQAKVTFESVIQAVPGGAAANQAESAIYELTQLGVGREAPTFTAQARDGSTISLHDYRGKAVLLVFWAST